MTLLSRWKAEAYTLLACCATAALGRAAREGGTDYPHSARLLRDVLDERRSVCCGTTYQPVPLAYTNLTGPLSLTSSDPVWAQLCVRGGPLPEVGLELLTSALAVAVASAECFQSAQGFAATLSRGGVAEVLAVESGSTVTTRGLPAGAIAHLYPGLLGRAHQAPGCATHLAQTAEPRGAQIVGGRRLRGGRGGRGRRFCGPHH